MGSREVAGSQTSCVHCVGVSATGERVAINRVSYVISNNGNNTVTRVVNMAHPSANNAQTNSANVCDVANVRVHASDAVNNEANSQANTVNTADTRSDGWNLSPREGGGEVMLWSDHVPDRLHQMVHRHDRLRRNLLRCRRNCPRCHESFRQGTPHCFSANDWCWNRPHYSVWNRLAPDFARRPLMSCNVRAFWVPGVWRWQIHAPTSWLPSSFPSLRRDDVQ